MPMLTTPYGAAAAKLNCLSPPLPTLGATPSSRKSFHPWKKMSDGHYPFAHAPHYPVMTSSLSGSRGVTSERGGGGVVGIGDGSGGGFAVHGYSYRGSGMSSSCAMAPACVLPPGAGATAAVPTGRNRCTFFTVIVFGIDVGDEGDWGTCPPKKWREKNFGQSSCKIRVFSGRISCKMPEFC